MLYGGGAAGGSVGEAHYNDGGAGGGAGTYKTGTTPIGAHPVSTSFRLVLEVVLLTLLMVVEVVALLHILDHQ